MEEDRGTLYRHEVISDLSTLDRIVSRAIWQNRRSIEARRIEVDLDLEMGLMAMPGSKDLRHAITQAVQIAVNASPTKGTIYLTGFCCGQNIILEIADDGPGFSESVTERNSELEASTAPTNLYHLSKLPAVAALVQRLGGRLSVRNCPEGGGAITFQLPRSRLPVQRRAAA